MSVYYVESLSLLTLHVHTVVADVRNANIQRGSYVIDYWPVDNSGWLNGVICGHYSISRY